MPAWQCECDSVSVNALSNSMHVGDEGCKCEWCVLEQVCIWMSVHGYESCGGVCGKMGCASMCGVLQGMLEQGHVSESVCSWQDTCDDVRMMCG